jgi:hypothetical protein
MTGNFIVYLIGYVVAIVGVGYALFAAGVGSEWIIAVVLIMVGLGIVYAMSRSQTDKLAQGHHEGPEKTQTTVIQQSPPSPAQSTQPPSREHRTE